jgi:small subunit ribosomal protein S7
MAKRPRLNEYAAHILYHAIANLSQYLAVILNRLRTAPAPRVNSHNQIRPLVPGHPPGEQLPFDPVGYLTLAIDSLSPLIRIRSERGIKGGGAALAIPVPLNVRQRRRRSITWIIDAASKKKNRGSGKNTFPLRVADEIIAIVEGRSPLWDKRLHVHKEGVVGRVNVSAKRQKGRRL